jgi:hypothetical protein
MSTLGGLSDSGEKSEGNFSARASGARLRFVLRVDCEGLVARSVAVGREEFLRPRPESSSSFPSSSSSLELIVFFFLGSLDTLDVDTPAESSFLGIIVGLVPDTLSVEGQRNIATQTFFLQLGVFGFILLESVSALETLLGLLSLPLDVKEFATHFVGGLLIICSPWWGSSQAFDTHDGCNLLQNINRKVT